MPSAINLYWLPLGAGGHSVRYNGRAFEWVVSRVEHRISRDLYHSALEVRVRSDRYVIEMTPVRRGDPAARGAVVTGPVGSRWAGRWQIFRYEVRRWRGGVIPDVAEAVASPQRLTNSGSCASQLLDVVAELPAPVWGRDELEAGEMWNSNSVIAWLLARSGLEPEMIGPPAGGRAPGWDAGCVVARRISPPSRALGAPPSRQSASKSRAR